MADNLITTDLATKMAVKAFIYNTPFTQTIRSYSDRFSAPAGSRNVSTSINIPKPARYISQGGRGTIDFTFDAQDSVEEKVALTIDSMRSADLSFDLFTRKMDVSDFDNQLKNEDMAGLTQDVEADHLEEVKKVSNVVLAGSTGASFSDATTGLAVLKENGIPAGDLTMLCNQRIQSSLLANNYTAFSGDKSTDKAYIAGYIGSTFGGFDWMSSELIPIHSNGTATDGSYDGTTGLTPLGTVTSAPANGANTLAIESIGTDGTITAGSIIQVASVNKVNAITRADQGVVRQFAVESTVTSSGNAVTLTLTERFVDGTGTAGSGLVDKSLQNVTALPATSAVVSLVGKVSTNYRQAIGYCKDTFGGAFTPLATPSNAPSSVSTQKGMTIRAIEDFNYQGDLNILRLHSVFGVSTFRPEWGVRIWEEI